MANSYIEPTPSSSAIDVSALKYLSITDLKAIGSNDSRSTWTDLTVSYDATAKQVTVTNGGSYSILRIYRSTTQTQLVDFQNGSRLSERDLDTAYQQGLYVAQEVAENAPATGYPATGAQGIQGIQGVAGNNGADGVSPTTALSTSFESSEQTIAGQAFSVSVAHGLSSVPKLCQAVLRCKTAEQNYSIGDEFHLTNEILVQDATNVTLCSDAALNVKNKTNYATFNPTVANWKLVLRAFI